jgi:hypothetical protein
VRCKSPGRANCQLSYPLEEKVLEVNVLDKVCRVHIAIKLLLLSTRNAAMQQQCHVDGRPEQQQLAASKQPDSAGTSQQLPDSVPYQTMRQRLMSLAGLGAGESSAPGGAGALQGRLLRRARPKCELAQLQVATACLSSYSACHYDSYVCWSYLLQTPARCSNVHSAP